MAQILKDFADLAVLKSKLSREEVIPTAKSHINPRARIRLQGNMYYDYSTYMDAAAAAVKAYPVISTKYKDIQYTSSIRDRNISFGNKVQRFFFRFQTMSEKRIFKSRDRLAAFRTIMFIYLELRKICATHIQIVEKSEEGGFVLSINEIPLVASSYRRYTGTFSMLKELKQQMIAGFHQPTSINDEVALKMGINFREKVEASSIYDLLEIAPEIDYSSFGHSERITVYTEPGYTIKMHQSSSSSNNKVIPGRSQPAEQKKIHRGPSWMESWNDRFDHDD